MRQKHQIPSGHLRERNSSSRGHAGFAQRWKCAGTDARGGNVQRPRGCPAQLLAEPIAVSAQCTPHDSKKGEAAVGSRVPESFRCDHLGEKASFCQGRISGNVTEAYKPKFRSYGPPFQHSHGGSMEHCIVESAVTGTLRRAPRFLPILILSGRRRLHEKTSIHSSPACADDDSRKRTNRPAPE